MLFVNLFVFCGVFIHVNSLKCHVCTFSEVTTDHSTVNSFLSSLNLGNNDCWNTPSAATTTCLAGVTSCTTLRSDVNLKTTYLGTSFDMKMRSVVKTCGGTATSDSCTEINVQDLVSGSLASLKAVGMTIEPSGEYNTCQCTTDGCNHGAALKYSVLLVLGAVLAAVKAIF